MTLYLIGLGIEEEVCLPNKVQEWIGKASEVYIDVYTTPLRKTIFKMLSSSIGIDREIIPADRILLEQRIGEIIDRARSRDIAILTGGNPLIATTHKSIMIEAAKKGVEVKVYGNTSAYLAAIAESGLDIYKFGASGTLVRGGYSINKRNFEILEGNWFRGLHTLYFMEYSYEDNFMMKPSQAIDILLSNDRSKKILEDEETWILLLISLGTSNMKRLAFKSPEKVKEKIFKDEPSIMIVTAHLHFVEKEFIHLFYRIF